MRMILLALLAVAIVSGCTTPPPEKTAEQAVLEQFSSIVTAPYRPTTATFTVTRGATICNGLCDQYVAQWQFPVTSGPYAGGNASGTATLFYFNNSFIPGSVSFLLTGNVSLLTDGVHPIIPEVFAFNATNESYKDEPEFRYPAYYGETDEQCLFVRVSTFKQCPPEACLVINDDYKFCDNSQCTGLFNAVTKYAITNNVPVICEPYKQQFDDIAI